MNMVDPAPEEIPDLPMEFDKEHGDEVDAPEKPESIVGVLVERGRLMGF